MFVNGIGTKWEVFIEDRPYILPTTFRIIWPCGFRGEELKKSANQKQESPVVAMFVNGSGRNKQSLTLQRDLDKPVQWEQLWKMAFHPDKCNVIKHL